MEFHQPSHRQAVAFFIFSLFLVAGLLAWTFVLNKGELVVSGAAPFTVKAGGEQKKCDSSPCTLKLKPRSYTVSLSKSGFYNESETVEVKRGGRTMLAAALEIIPVVREVGTALLPFDEAPLSPTFLGKTELPKFPKNAVGVLASNSEKFLLLAVGRELFVYEVSSATTKKMPLTAEKKPLWLGDELVYLETDAAEKQTLTAMNLAGEKTLISSFARTFVNPVVVPSPDGNFVLIREENNDHYLIDVAKKSRQRLALEPGARAVKWVGSYIIVEEKINDETKITARDPESDVRIHVPAKKAELVIKKDDEALFFISDEKYNEQGSAEHGVSIGEIVEEVVVARTSTVYLTRLEIAKNELFTLASVAVTGGAGISRIHYDAASEKIHFIKESKLFEVALK